jgi:inner membrane protease ATP23
MLRRLFFGTSILLLAAQSRQITFLEEAENGNAREDDDEQHRIPDEQEDLDMTPMEKWARQKQFAECVEKKDLAFKRSRLVRFLMSHLRRNGCPVDPATFVRCVQCSSNTINSAVNMKENGDIEVVMCCNNLQDQKLFETSLAHELIHVFDYCRADLNFNSCRHHACTEIRASNLSTECNFTRELQRWNFEGVNHHRDCVRRRATLSVRKNPNCTKLEAIKAVDDVFDRCLADTEPFESVPF